MKKLLMTGILSLGLMFSLSACAETTVGKVVKTDGNHVTIEKKDGSQATMKTTDETVYRKKEKMKTASGNETHQYVPILEEADIVEVIYDPKTDTEWIIEEVIIWED